MAIDFKKKLASRTIEPKTNPIELYETLDRKSVAGPLRPAQEVVLSEWYTKRRMDKDLIIKLSMLDFYIATSFEKRIISKKKFESTSMFIVEIRKIAYGLVRNETKC